MYNVQRLIFERNNTLEILNKAAEAGILIKTHEFYFSCPELDLFQDIPNDYFRDFRKIITFRGISKSISAKNYYEYRNYFFLCMMQGLKDKGIKL